MMAMMIFCAKKKKTQKKNNENDSSRNPPRYWEETAQSKHTAADNAKGNPLWRMLFRLFLPFLFFLVGL